MGTNKKDTEDEVGTAYPSITFNLHKIPNEGEDAYPLCIVNPNQGILGAFDGNGGTNKRTYEEKDNKSNRHTGAYFASRFVRTSCKNLFTYAIKEKDPISYFDTYLISYIKEDLNIGQSSLVEPNPSKVSFGGLNHLFATTMAVIYYRQNTDYEYTIVSYWSGDARNYILSPDKIYYLTLDDNKNDEIIDPFDALAGTTLGNRISQNVSFYINKFSQTITVLPDEPVILLSVSDGCFDCWQSPEEFDELLRTTLLASDSMEDWKSKLVSKYETISQDDVSLALTILNYSSFSQLKNAFTKLKPDKDKKKQSVWQKLKEWWNNLLAREKEIDLKLEECRKVSSARAQKSKLEQAVEAIKKELQKQEDGLSTIISEKEGLQLFEQLIEGTTLIAVKKKEIIAQFADHITNTDEDIKKAKDLIQESESKIADLSQEIAKAAEIANIPIEDENLLNEKKRKLEVDKAELEKEERAQRKADWEIYKNQSVEIIAKENIQKLTE